MDKYFLLTYTGIGIDSLRHAQYAWFSTEDEMRAFVSAPENAEKAIEVDMAIEILSHRIIDL